MNCGIIYWTSNSLNIILEDWDYDETQKFMIIVLIEHVIIGFKLFLANVIKDKPTWVSKEERQQAEELDELYEMLDEKADEYRQQDGGKKTLDDKIRELKSQNMGDKLQKKFESQNSRNFEDEELKELLGVGDLAELKYQNYKSKKRVRKVQLQEL